MQRPKTWDLLPHNLRENIVSNCEIDYDGYDESRIDAEHSILCNPAPFHRNYQAAQSYYLALSDDNLKTMAQNNINSLQHQIDSLITFLNK